MTVDERAAAIKIRRTHVSPSSLEVESVSDGASLIFLCRVWSVFDVPESLIHTEVSKVFDLYRFGSHQAPSARVQCDHELQVTDADFEPFFDAFVVRCSGLRGHPGPHFSFANLTCSELGWTVANGVLRAVWLTADQWDSR